MCGRSRELEYIRDKEQGFLVENGIPGRLSLVPGPRFFLLLMEREYLHNKTLINYMVFFNTILSICYAGVIVDENTMYTCNTG